jgi:ankyrin repeat protein
MIAIAKLLKEANLQRRQRVEGWGGALPEKKEIFRKAFSDTLRDQEPVMHALWKKRQLERGASIENLSWKRFVMEVRTPDRRCNTKLHEFAAHNQVTFLLVCLHCTESPLYLGSLLNHMNADMETPLVVAIKKRHYDAAAIMLQYGADPCAQWSLSHPAPLHIAAKESTKDIVALLVRYGAHHRDSYFDNVWDAYLTPFDIATFRVKQTHSDARELDEAEAVYEYLLKLNPAI